MLNEDHGLANAPPSSILVVGYFVSWMRGRSSPSEDLANYLSYGGWTVLHASPVRNRVLR